MPVMKNIFMHQVVEGEKNVPRLEQQQKATKTYFLHCSDGLIIQGD